MHKLEILVASLVRAGTDHDSSALAHASSSLEASADSGATPDVSESPPLPPPQPEGRDDDAPRASSRRERRRPAREVLDIFIEGANVTARVSDAQASCVLRDLGLAVADLARAGAGKSIVRFYDDPWELCIERLGRMSALSVYRAGNDPSVAVYDRAVPFEEVVESAIDAIDRMLLAGNATRPIELELRSSLAALRAIDRARLAEYPLPAAPTPVVVEIDRDAPLAFAAEFVLRARSGEPGDASIDASVERADLHALLFRGRMRAEIRGRGVELGDGHPFLVAERLLETARRAHDAWERGQAMMLRSEAGDVLVGIRVAPSGDLALTLGAAAPGAGQGERAVYTFPALAVADVLESALAFGRALVRAILRRDRTQCTNLRLSAFRRQLRDASDALREVSRQDVKVNPTPEPYRVFAAFAESARSAPSDARSLTSVRLRYTSRWRALVPGIDLRSTFLCGDRLVVGAAQETFGLARATGAVLWRVPTQKAISVVTPGGLARLHPDGALDVHDFGNGEVTLRTRVAPRLGGPPAGAVVNVPGLPRLLIVTEGDRHLVAIDLTSGEARWRFAWGNRGALRLKRAGKLLYFTSGDSALTALDVLTGSVVWRVRDRLRFRSAPTLDHDALFAVAGGVNCATHLHAIDAFSGRERWTQAVPANIASCTVEGSPLVAGGIVAVAVRERQGLKLLAFDRETGKPRWSAKAVVAPIGTSWLAIDDLLIGNSPTGELLAVEAESGELRYRQVLGTVLETDVPRRLEPVLRSGALFVPFSDVYVFRPRDGASLGSISPCDAIPDLLRVDERCDVYIAEESGHLVSFSGGPRLSLVPSA